MTSLKKEHHCPHCQSPFYFPVFMCAGKRSALFHCQCLACGEESPFVTIPSPVDFGLADSYTEQAFVAWGDVVKRERVVA